jgi:hypothetical protein
MSPKENSMTEEQITNTFEALIGMTPRKADIMVCTMMGGTPEIVAEYIWDHWLGEPESPTLSEVEEAVRSFAK